MQIRILRRCIAGAVLLCSGANAQTVPTRAEAEAMRPQQLARLLLGDDRAARVVEARIGGIPGPRLSVVSLYEAPVSLPEGLCARRTYVVYLSAPGAISASSSNEGYQGAVEKIRVGRWLGIAGKSGCNGNNRFVEPLGMQESELRALLKRLVSIRRQAASGRALSFSLECSEEPVGPSACTDGGRTALATLPLERITDIRPIYEPKCIIAASRVLASSCLHSLGERKRTIVAWRAELPNAGARGTTWFLGLAPRDNVRSVELKRVLVQSE